MLRSTLPLFAFALAASAPAVAQEAVPVPGFRSVQLRAGGQVLVVPGPVQRVTMINGSREFTRFQVNRDGQLEIATSCNDRCPHHYNLRIQIETPNLPDLAIHAGGTIKVEPGFGFQRNVSAAISAGGTIDLSAVAVDGASAAIRAGGDILINARSRLNVAINAGGHVRYAANPQVSMAIANGGSISRLH